MIGTEVIYPIAVITKPIALATLVSKMFESVLLFNCAEFLSISDNQFGFQSSHSTDLCTCNGCIYSLYIERLFCCNLYCAPVWFDCTKAALKRLKITYNNSL